MVYNGLGISSGMRSRPSRRLLRIIDDILCCVELPKLKPSETK